MPVFRPLPNDTLTALTSSSATSAASVHADTAQSGEPTDVGDDDTFLPPCDNPYRRRGADDADETELVDDDSVDDDLACALDELDELGEWAACGGGGAANLTARLRPRNNANAAHAAPGNSHLVDRLDRAEDRRRQHVARDKLDRATVEQVLDPRTRMILFRLLSRARLSSIDGCVSTGKEANVYYGTAPPACVAETATDGGAGGTETIDVAVKVFKTAILSFKDRERYVAGEHRFRRGGYNRQSNRKMVQQWTEKEYRNLLRLQEAGVPSPTPLVIKPPVLIMEFFGRDGWPAPRLKDAQLSPERMISAYSEVCVLMRRMFCRAKLVHGDLSEYNILYHKRQVIIIDVSQSVEDDHPMALDFLRRDCVNVNDFFARSGVAPVLGLRELFEFITAATEELDGPDARAAEDLRVEATLRVALLAAEARSEEECSRFAADDVVFNQSFIPRSLDEIYNGDTDMHRTMSTDHEARIRYAKLTGNVIDASGDAANGATATKSREAASSTSGAESDDDSDSGRDSWASEEGKQTADERKSARRVNKQEVRAAARERREQKLPKHVKKRKEAVAKRRRHVKTKK
jgi:RIO kinase 1